MSYVILYKNTKHMPFYNSVFNVKYIIDKITINSSIHHCSKVKDDFDADINVKIWKGEVEKYEDRIEEMHRVCVLMYYYITHMVWVLM